MRIGIVCPYSLDVHGGVQSHVRGLALELRRRGHHVSVLAPGRANRPEPHVELVGWSLPLPYNGSVARVRFGPGAAVRVSRWSAAHEFDVVHVHEPTAPSLSLLAAAVVRQPVVATFHHSMELSRAFQATSFALAPVLRRLSAAVVVSRHAGGDVQELLGVPVEVIPNGLDTTAFRDAHADPDLVSAAGTVAFVGRLGEARKGFELALRTMETVAADRLGVRLVVVGQGPDVTLSPTSPLRTRGELVHLRDADDRAKAAVLASSDVYLATNTHGESFGIVLAEAMAAGVAAVASDLPAFRDLLGPGPSGLLVPVGDVAASAVAVRKLLDDPRGRATLADRAAVRVRRFDWRVLAGRLEAIYGEASSRLPRDRAGPPSVTWDVHPYAVSRGSS